MTKTKMPKESWGRYIHDERKKKTKIFNGPRKTQNTFS